MISIIEREATFENNSDMDVKVTQKTLSRAFAKETQWSKTCSTVKSTWQAKHRGGLAYLVVRPFLVTDDTAADRKHVSRKKLILYAIQNHPRSSVGHPPGVCLLAIPQRSMPRYNLNNSDIHVDL